jgi:NADPH:quinone reductase-like Zn-dependent oxidoreductase
MGRDDDLRRLQGTERWALMDELRSAYIPTGTTYSCVAGYQRAGLVTELGPGVTDDAVGERVAVWGSPERTVFEGADAMWGCHVSEGPASEYLKPPIESRTSTPGRA